MKTRVCDICKRPDKYCAYKVQKRMKFCARTYGMYGEPDFMRRMDVCDDCFDKFVKFVKGEKKSE